MADTPSIPAETSTKLPQNVADLLDSAPQTPQMRILLAAGPIFADKGFRDTTIREICEAASVNVASVNYYFGDKQKLYHEAVLFARQMQAAQSPEPSWDESTPSADRLRLFIAMILKRMVVNEQAPWQVRLLLNEIQNPTETCVQLVEDYFRPFMQSLANLVRDIAGDPIDPLFANQLVLSIVGQCMIYRFAPQTLTMTLGDLFEDQDREQQLDRLTDLITHFSLAGIRAAVSKTKRQT
ncbi:MAG: CerR family C-terminal domain-containing protein [Planctomycetota bacterium]